MLILWLHFNWVFMLHINVFWIWIFFAPVWPKGLGCQTQCFGNFCLHLSFPLDYQSIETVIWSTNCHTFPKAHVATNKNVHNIWRSFLAQHFMSLHMVWSVLFPLSALETTLWLVKILQQPFSSFYWNGFKLTVKPKWITNMKGQ